MNDNDATQKAFPWKRFSFDITRHQVRGGRAMAGISITELAAAIDVAESTVRNIETGRVKRPGAHTMTAIRTALEDRGVEFGPFGWVRYGARDADINHTP